MVVATALITRRRRVLLLQRSRTSHTFRGYWQLPEGKVDVGEHPAKALVRELREELHCRTKAVRLVGLMSTVGMSGGERIEALRALYRAVLSGSLQLSRDHAAYVWALPANAHRGRRLVPGTRAVLRLCAASRARRQ